MTDIDYQKKCQELEREVDHYKKVLGVGVYNPAGEAFSVLVEQLRQRSEYIKNFKIVNSIGNVAKEDPVYARATDLIDTLPKMISQVNALSMELKIEYKPEDAAEKKGATSPQNLVSKTY